MRWLLFILISISLNAHAQVDMSEKEKIEQQRNENLKQDALKNEALKPNTKTTSQATYTIEDTGANFEVDHSALGYSYISESDNQLEGVKFSGAFSVAIYNEKKKDKHVRIMAGVELPIENDFFPNRLVPFGGGGFQFGAGFSLYANLGLDYRILKWFKLQAGLNFDSSHNLGTIIGAALTW